jgi:hypothetical protein
MKWAQEVMSRAFALQVLARCVLAMQFLLGLQTTSSALLSGRSNVGSWQVLGPKGSAVQQGSPGQSLMLLQQLLKPAKLQPAGRKDKAPSENSPQAVQAGPAGPPDEHQGLRSTLQPMLRAQARRKRPAPAAALPALKKPRASAEQAGHAAAQRGKQGLLVVGASVKRLPVQPGAKGKRRQ